MLKREISYEDFDGNQVTEVFYFNISKPELIELEVEQEKGLSGWIQQIIDTKDNRELIKQFKRIVLLAYGEKSADGKRFVKSDAMREEFSQTAAYTELFMELAMNENAAAEFLKAVLPKDLVAQTEGTPAASIAPVPPQGG